MGKRASYPPGTFSWVDLATTDAAEAKAFYAGLFGWELEDTDVGDGSIYTMCRVDGDAVCGLYQMSEDARARGVAPSWLNYVTVVDADTAAARGKELAGAVIADAFDVLGLGRMAVMKDTEGAVFAVWQPGTHIGAERVNDVGCLCMNELATSDIEATRSFYGALFGWTIEDPDDPDGPSMVVNRGNVNGAVFVAAKGGAPHWRPCFTVESTESALERVRELGGEQLSVPLDIGHGSVAMVLDPQGALFTMFAGEVDP